jgi:hypothetical protein
LNQFVFLFKTTSQIINNPLTQVNFHGGPIAPTTIAAALSAASYSGATAVTSSM